jgi:phosphonate transport system permease protein
LSDRIAGALCQASHSPHALAGSGAVFLTETGTLGKLYAEGLENVDNKPHEGIRSTGASTLLTYRFGILSQVLPVMASQTLYQWESNVRGATIIGAVGAGGIGLKL